jgi:uncharacterized membrane protein YeaQ/YmgE (transglycosylase-associated protein family)
MAMNIILWIIFGGLAGWIGSMIAGTDREQGVVGNVVVGIIGAFIGGGITRAIGGSGVTGFNLPSLIVAILGAVILLFIVRMFRGGRSHHTTV